MMSQQKRTDEDIKRNLDQYRIQLQGDPENDSLRQIYAMDLSENGYIEEAIVQYNVLISRFPREPDLYYNLGVLKEKLNDFKGAINAYTQAIKIEPCFVDAHYNLAYALDRSGNIKAAVESYNRTLELDPEDANAHFNLGCLLSKCGDSEGAIKHLTSSIKLNPRDEYAYFYLAFEMQNQGALDEALTYYNRVLEINPDYSWAHYNKGYIYLSRNQKELAYDAFKATYRLNESDYKAFKFYVELSIELGKHDNILDVLENRIVLNPVDAVAHFYIAEIYFAQKELEDAQHHYRKALTSPELPQSGIDVKKIQQKLNLLQADTGNRA